VVVVEVVPNAVKGIICTNGNIMCLKPHEDKNQLLKNKLFQWKIEVISRFRVACPT
jgi:hypothetical protein